MLYICYKTDSFINLSHYFSLALSFWIEGLWSHITQWGQDSITEILPSYQQSMWYVVFVASRATSRLCAGKANSIWNHAWRPLKRPKKTPPSIRRTNTGQHYLHICLLGFLSSPKYHRVYHQHRKSVTYAPPDNRQPIWNGKRAPLHPLTTRMIANTHRRS